VPTTVVRGRAETPCIYRPGFHVSEMSFQGLRAQCRAHLVYDHGLWQTPKPDLELARKRKKELEEDS